MLIPVDGMSCGSCAARLKRGLKDVDGVVGVEVSLDPGGARVRYVLGKTNPDRLVEAINALEFTAGPPKPSAP
ncbi:MAG TPA: heavy-metal-associated domain-containing protein [Polyangiaceae bacterium]|nr:heavy-metal-associated domain-containing protein [Polyangiaceae bacterium]